MAWPTKIETSMVWSREGDDKITRLLADSKHKENHIKQFPRIQTNEPIATKNLSIIKKITRRCSKNSSCRYDSLDKQPMPECPVLLMPISSIGDTKKTRTLNSLIASKFQNPTLLHHSSHKIKTQANIKIMSFYFIFPMNNLVLQKYKTLIFTKPFN
jgi:hypothetical protein